MRWRTRLVVLLGFLLPVPLVWLFHAAVTGGAPQERPEARVAPMLSTEERRSLLSYQRDCRTSEDCEPPLGCFANPRVMATYCTDSRCLTDRHCPEGFFCQTMTTKGDGPLIRACALVGLRKEGEECLRMPPTPEAGCEQGLLCKGWCGRPCRLDEPASCPEGFFCREGREGASCLPSCEGRTCPEGQRCIQFDEGVSVCAQIHGEDCQRAPCPEGQRCLVHSPVTHPGEVWMWCLISCGEEGATCPEGLICHSSFCRQPCDPSVPGTCGPYYRCARYAETQPWTCRPDHGVDAPAR
jgi:hypothetical protein